jgi:hypothetical protein
MARAATVNSSVTHPTVLGLQDPPSLLVTEETGPLEPVPTMMQVLDVVHAMAISPKLLLG